MCTHFAYSQRLFKIFFINVVLYSNIVFSFKIILIWYLLYYFYTALLIDVFLIIFLQMDLKVEVKVKEGISTVE